MSYLSQKKMEKLFYVVYELDWYLHIYFVLEI